MPKIVNLKTEVVDLISNLKKANNIITNNISKFKKELDYDLYDLMPEEKFNIVSFNIKESNSAFANAIRRTIASEMPIWSLELDVDNFESDDPYVRFDDLATKINSTPIHQTYINKLSKEGKNPNRIIKFKIYIRNDTPQMIHVYSNNIDISDGYKGSEDLIIQNIPLQALSSNSYIRVKLKLVRGYGYENGAKFSATPMPHYFSLDHTPLETRYKQSSLGVSSLVVDPKEFYFKYDTYINYKNPLDIMTICIEELKRRVRFVLGHLHDFEKKPKTIIDIPKDLQGKIIMYKNEIIEIRKEGKTYFINIKGESTTISKLFSRYIYDAHRGIELVTDADDHPSIRAVTIKIQDVDAIKLMLKAGEKIISDFDSIKKTFS